MAAAGRVPFGRHEATLRDIWMAHAFFASLGDERECFATAEHLAEQSRRCASTVRTHQRTLIARSLIETDNRKGGRKATCWRVVLPADCRPGQQQSSPRATATVAERRDRKEEIPFPKEVHPGDPVQGGPPTSETDTASPIPSTTTRRQVKGGGSRQARLYAKLYRKVKDDGWPDLTDGMIDTFEALDHGAKKAALDLLLAREQAGSDAGTMPPAPSGMTPLSSIGGGARTIDEMLKADARQRRPSRHERAVYQANCRHEYQDGCCRKCGAERDDGAVPDWVTSRGVNP